MDEKGNMRKNINQLKKLFNYIPEFDKNNIIPSDKLVGYLDKTLSVMLIPKNYFLKSIITQDFDVTESKVMDINYNNSKGCKGYYSVELLNLIMPLLKNTNSLGINITVAEDMPIIFETNEIKIIMAPRTQNDNEV